MSDPHSEASDDWPQASPPRRFVAAGEHAGARIDVWLSHALGPDASRTRVQQLVRGGAVTLNGEPATEPKRKVEAGDVAIVSVPEPEPPQPLPEAIPLDILHEDRELIVLVKPPGLVVHPGPGNWSGTLVNALIHHCGASLSGIGGVRRPGIVHRLDKETSGVMVVAKTDAAHRALSEAFADHGRSGDLERAYLALVWGAPARMSGTVDAPLGRAGGDRTRRAVVSEAQGDARHAVTHYAVRERFPAQSGETASLLECRLETGRTHQIRVHMTHIGHPIVGDPDYGQGFRTKANRLPDGLRERVASFPRQALHAATLGFRHPASGEVMRFEAPMPPDMAELVDAFRIVPR